MATSGLQSVCSGSSSTISLRGAPDQTIGDEQADRQLVQALHVHLARDSVRDMQKAQRSGKPVHINLGPRPSLQFESCSLALSVTKSPFRHELYTLSSEGGDGKQHISHDAQFAGLVSHRLVVEQADESAANALAAADKLKEQMRSWQQDRDVNSSASVNIVKSGGGKRSLGRAALTKVPSQQQSLSSSQSSAKPSTTMPVSNPNKATRDRIERAQRVAFIHFLSAEPALMATICKMTNMTEKACGKLCEKYCDQGPNGLFTLVDRAYKEFDVGRIRFPKDGQIKSAVDNAIHAFDRMRIPRDDALWQKLLPAHERGKGKCLSRLSTLTSDKVPGDHRKLLAGAGGEPMARTKSSESAVKAKKPTEREKQVKRLSSKKTGTAAAVKQPLAKSVKPVEKPKLTDTGSLKRKTDSKALSAEYIQDSDEEVKEADEHMGLPRKKVKTNDCVSTPVQRPIGATKTASAAAKAAPKPVNTTASGSPMRGASKSAVTPKKATIVKTISPSKPPLESSPTQVTTSKVLPKAPAASAKEVKKTTSTAESGSAVRNDIKPASHPRSASSTVSTTSSSAHRINASQSSISSTASAASRKRPSTSSVDEGPLKKQRIAASPTGSASSPLASSVSSTSSHASIQTKAARLPDLPPKRAPATTSTTPRQTKLSELQDLHSKVFSDYVQLRIRVEKNSEDDALRAKLAEKFDEYDFLSNELASLSHTSKSELPIPATVSFPRDSSVYFLTKYNEALPRYNKMLEEIKSPSDAEKQKLWELHNRLSELKRLHQAAEKGEQLVKQQALIDLSIKKPQQSNGNADAAAPLTRRQTLEQYKTYHQLFAAWTSFREKQRGHPSYPHLPSSTLQEDRQMYSRICSLHSSLLGGFARMRRLFSKPPAGVVSLDDPDAGPPLGARDAELLAWKTKSRLREWGDRHDAVFQKFGQCTGADMDDLWARQRELQQDQRAVLRALALDFGKKSTGRLDNLSLDEVVVSLGRAAGADANGAAESREIPGPSKQFKV